MSWFADLAGRAESLLNNLDEQTGVVLRNHNGIKEKKHEFLLHPDATWGQKKRTVPRNPKKNVSISDTKSNYAPTVKSSPTKFQNIKSPAKQSHDNVKTLPDKSRKKSPQRKATQYNLNNSPKTLMDDLNEHESIDHFGLRRRRYSLPSDLEIINSEQFTYNMQNLEVENAMLKNELNVMNREVSELLDRLRKTEDELKSVNIKLQTCEKLNQKLNEEKDLLNTQTVQLQQKVNETSNIQTNKYKEKTQELESEIGLAKDRNKILEDKIRKLSEDLDTKDLTLGKLDKELRHAHTTISEKQSDIEKKTAECIQLEKDWEAYKLRVKSMLFAKDNEIKSLREGGNLTEDAKMLMEQLETLKEEKEDLSHAISQVRNECGDMKQYVNQLENKHSATERVVTALRDALKEERIARNRAEVQCSTYGKELQAFQIETGQTIASLRKALQDKDEELNHIRETASTVRTSDTSALNVADYDVTRDGDDEKINYLTQTLIQKQGKIDSLLADNNILRIQLDKMESKYRTELASLRAQYSHSIVQLQDADCRTRSRLRNTSALAALSLRIGVMTKRFPLFRILIMIYMIGLHLWVLTVLFTSTPEDYVPRPTKL